jgi:hypothetical protein
MSTASLQPSPAAAQTLAPNPAPRPSPAAANPQSPQPELPRLTHEELYQDHLESIARTNRFIARTVRDCRRYFVDVAQGRAPLCPDRLKGALIGSRCRFLTMPRPARPRRSADMDDEDFFPSPPPPARPSKPTRPSQTSAASGASSSATSGPGSNSGPAADAPRLPRTAPAPTKPAPAAARALSPEAAAERAQLESKLSSLMPRYEELVARRNNAKTQTDTLYHQRRLSEFESDRLMPLVHRLVALGSDLIPAELRPNADPTPNSPSAAA